MPEIHELAPDAVYVGRRGEVNACDNEDFVRTVRATGRKTLIMAGVWTSVFTIMSIKITSYSSVVGVWELTFAAREVVERTLAAFEIFTGVMAMYFLLCFPLSLISSRLERTLSISSSR